MKILGVVILYNPDINKAISNIEKYAAGLSKLIVWNNTQGENIESLKPKFQENQFYEKMLFMGNKGNVGLVEPINIAITKAINEDYDGLLTMDQDTIWTDFNYYIDKISKFGIKGAIFTPSINNLQGDLSKEISIRDEPLINSGTIYSKESLLKIGLMNDVFFTEGLDNEYYFRALKNNIPVFIVSGAIILQNIEDINYYRFPIKIVACRFSAQRLYNITFAIRYIMREFSSDKSVQNYYKWWIRHHYGLKLIIKIVLFEKNKIKKLYMYFKGFIDANKANVIAYK